MPHSRRAEPGAPYLNPPAALVAGTSGPARPAGATTPSRDHEPDTSDGGGRRFRTVSWVELESGRFHQGLSLVLLLLAALILTVEMIRFPGGAKTMLLRIVLALTGLPAWRRARNLARHSSQVPGPSAPRVRPD